MTNHPNRWPKGPASNPAPEAIRAAREETGLTQTDAAALVYGSLRAWQQWEAGDRRMHPAVWDLFRARTLSAHEISAAFSSWWGEPQRSDDTVDEAAEAAWKAACEWVLTRAFAQGDENDDDE